MQTANKAWLPLGAKLTDAQYASFRAVNCARNLNPNLPSSFQRI